MDEVSTNQRNDLLDIKAAAEYLGVAETFIRHLVLEKRVAYHKLGRYLRFKASDLDALVERGRVEAVPNRQLHSQIRNPQLFRGLSARPNGARPAAS